MAETRKCNETSCDGNCSSCAHAGEHAVMTEPQNPNSNIKKVIGVVSGKGGVGKSLVTASLAVLTRKLGYSVGILDADITGPSIPKMFGVHEKAIGNDFGIYPCETDSGIKLMSINLLLETEESPVVWRGPVIAGAVKQFWTDVIWGDVDFLFVDMPPGTGDVPLTVFQSLPLDGIIIVTSPQELVSMIVEKAVNMASLMDIPVLGLVENYSYIVCPDCGKVIRPYGESKIETLAENYGTDVLAKLPIDSNLASQCDKGLIELFEGDYMERAADIIEKKLVK